MISPFAPETDMQALASQLAMPLGVVLAIAVAIIVVLLVRARKAGRRIRELEGEVAGLKAMGNLHQGALSDEGDSVVYASFEDIPRDFSQDFDSFVFGEASEETPGTPAAVVDEPVADEPAVGDKVEPDGGDVPSAGLSEVKLGAHSVVKNSDDIATSVYDEIYRRVSANHDVSATGRFHIG